VESISQRWRQAAAAAAPLPEITDYEPEKALSELQSQSVSPVTTEIPRGYESSIAPPSYRDEPEAAPADDLSAVYGQASAAEAEESAPVEDRVGEYSWEAVSVAITDTAPSPEMEIEEAEEEAAAAELAAEDGVEASPTATGFDESTQPPADLVAAAHDGSVTRLRTHPLMTEDKIQGFARTLAGLTGVRAVTVGTVGADAFDIMVTHEPDTSVLGGLLGVPELDFRLLSRDASYLEIRLMEAS